MKVSIRRTTGVAAALVVAAAGLLVPTAASAVDASLPKPTSVEAGYFDGGPGANDAMIDVYWDGPGSTHDATKILKGYEIALLSGVSLSETKQTLTIDNPGATMGVFEDLTYGQTYDVGVRALYTVSGVPEVSEWVYADSEAGGPLIPLRNAPQPSAVSVTSPASGTLTARWPSPSIPANTEQVFLYVVTAMPEPDFTNFNPQMDSSSVYCFAPCNVATLKNLRNGVRYEITVTANGGSLYGEGAYAVATPYGAPNKPSALTATRKGTKAKLKWKLAKSTAGAPVTGYKIYVNGTLKKTVGKTTTSYTATKIKKGKTYTFTVKAYNAHGKSAALTLKKKWKKS